MIRCIHQFRTIPSGDEHIKAGVCILCDAVKRWGKTHKQVILTVENRAIPDENARRRKKKSKRNRSKGIVNHSRNHHELRSK